MSTEVIPSDDNTAEIEKYLSNLFVKGRPIRYGNQTILIRPRESNYMSIMGALEVSYERTSVNVRRMYTQERLDKYKRDTGKDVSLSEYILMRQYGY